jgi:hypothetical protein
LLSCYLATISWYLWLTKKLHHDQRTSIYNIIKVMYFIDLFFYNSLQLTQQIEYVTTNFQVGVQICVIHVFVGCIYVVYMLIWYLCNW